MSKTAAHTRPAGRLQHAAIPACLLLCLLPSSHTAMAGERLPLGDGKVSDTPRAGYVDACQSRFDGGGAFRNGPWLRGGYWYPEEKLQVAGNVPWPAARFSISQQDGQRIIRGNALPSHGTGVFPISPTDPVYTYDFNPNHIAAQTLELNLPLLPQLAAEPSCVPMGMIGITLNGVALFNALDAGGRDAAAHEVLDRCDGHPQPEGLYHYHDMSRCLKDTAGAQGRHSDLVGYALDGFGIYGLYGENGRELHNSDLDACHGHTHRIWWDGAMRVMYHYHMTREYPYSIGCLRGTPVQSALNAPPGRHRRDNRDSHDRNDWPGPPRDGPPPRRSPEDGGEPSDGRGWPPPPPPP